MNWPYLTIGQPVVDEVFKKYEFSSQLILIIFNIFQYFLGNISSIDFFCKLEIKKKLCSVLVWYVMECRNFHHGAGTICH